MKLMLSQLSTKLELKLKLKLKLSLAKKGSIVHPIYGKYGEECVHGDIMKYQGGFKEIPRLFQGSPPDTL